ncbi:MAG: hypothetical protein JXR64_10005 [Spirochaetales bacterium]|nr:hypothetical protein [Spirochaetales bacterium]
MKKSFLVFLFLISFSVCGIEVDRASLDVNLDITVEFENYIGPHLFYNSISEIRAIGTFLANEITPDIKGDGNYNNKYNLYHRPKAEWEDNLKSADILEITKDSQIDNIANIKLIISQYLIDNYGYSEKDADLLAYLIVIYNAVYRGDAEHFSKNYSAETVISNNSEFLGIDLQYFNWPGKSFIYIPLSNNIYLGKLSNIDSDTLIDEKIINIIKLEDPESIEIREDIIDLKEREFDELASEIANDISIIKNSDENVTEDKSLEDVPTLALESEIEKKEALLSEKEDLILELRDNLAEDKNKLITLEKSDTLKLVTSLLVRDSGSGILAEFVKIDQYSNIVNKSDVNTIRNKQYIQAKDSLYVIAGGSEKNQIISLGKISPDSFEVEKWADTACYENSTIIYDKNFLYSIIIIDNKHYIGQFDLDLNLISRSPVEIYKDCYLNLKSDIFYVQVKNNSIVLVNLSDFVSLSNE